MAKHKRYEAFPGSSRSKVNRAGERIRNSELTQADVDIIEEWREAHRAVLNTFQAILRNRTKGSDVLVAQRHKRKRTIYDKLHRYPRMQLARMDDVAGCRLIFPKVDELYAFRETFHRARFNHRLRNDPGKYDYIKKPKQSGYRGVHDVYGYDVRSEAGRALRGLLVEIQYRTLVQHAWATAVEVIGFITRNQPKFDRGDVRYREAMAFASEILARTREDRFGPFPELSDDEVVQKFLQLDGELHLLRVLDGLHSTDSLESRNRNAILIFSSSGEVEVKTFRAAPEALRALFQLEKEAPEKDIVLVRADSSEEVRLAFRNYFSDATDFVRLVTRGCEGLSGKEIIDVWEDAQPSSSSRKRSALR